MLQGVIMSEILSNNKIPRIYAYTEPQFKDKPWENGRTGKGLIKIGYTTKSAKERISEQFGTNKPIGNPYEILLDEIAIRDDGTYFTDHDVHKILEKLGCYRFKNSEWFECSLEEVEQAIFAVKNHKTDITKRIADFKMRPEQAQAVKLTSEYFRKYPYEKEHKTPHFLWNAKMRFGKTFTSYQLAKEMGWKKVLVLTFKPAVQNSWEEDLKSHVDFQGWQFISRTGTKYAEINHDKPFVWFASFQDVLQKTEAGGIKPRNEEIHLINWDCIILDEYHFGAWRDSAKDLYDAEDKKEQSKQTGEGLDYYDEEQMPLTTSAYLYLSGTPFRALNNGEFLEDQIFNWTYTDEQREKQNWNEKDGENPYLELPKMVLMTYKMPDEIKQIALNGEFEEFSLNEFFSASDKNGQYKFKYENEVVNWLNLIRGQYKASTIDELKIGKKPPMPYSDYRLLNALNHTFWFNELLDLVISGTASSMLARRWESALLVNVDNDTLTKLLQDEKAMSALERIEGFRNLNKELSTLVNKSEALKKAKQEKKESLSKDDKKELTDQEKEIKSKRKEIQEKLLKFATRIPVFMYLTDNREQTLKDVITQLEPELFKKVTGLTISDFELLVSIGIFNEQLMNSAVFAFKRYEDASLSYTGLCKHHEIIIGGFNTKVSKEEFINLV